MCSSKAPTPVPPAQAVPLPVETAEPARLQVAEKPLKRNGRSGLSIQPQPVSGRTAAGLSGLNIPK